MMVFHGITSLPTRIPFQKTKKTTPPGFCLPSRWRRIGKDLCRLDGKWHDIENSLGRGLVIETSRNGLTLPNDVENGSLQILGFLCNCTNSSSNKLFYLIINDIECNIYYRYSINLLEIDQNWINSLKYPGVLTSLFTSQRTSPTKGPTHRRKKSDKLGLCRREGHETTKNIIYEQSS